MTAAKPAAPRGIVIVTGRAELPWGGRCSVASCPYAVWPVLLPNGKEGFRVGGLIFARKEAAQSAGRALCHKIGRHRWASLVVTAAEQSDDFAALNKIAGR